MAGGGRDARRGAERHGGRVPARGGTPAARSAAGGAEEADRRLFADALAVRALETWRVVHLPVAINFAVLALLHILTVLVLG
ncbi:MAG: hypothetical protein IPK07_33215 [Deltaproteobacteria bacterium]|nr:hypothetical protein [Deltaproteobacteria bacterium]